MHIPAQFAGFFFIDQAFTQKPVQHPAFMFIDCSVWLSSELLFFHRLLGLCTHEVWLPLNKIVFSLYITKCFLSLSIFVLLKDFSWNKNCWNLSMLLRGDICLTFEKTVWAFLMTNKQFNTWYWHEDQYLQGKDDTKYLRVAVKYMI